MKTTAPLYHPSNGRPPLPSSYRLALTRITPISHFTDRTVTPPRTFSPDMPEAHSQPYLHSSKGHYRLKPSPSICIEDNDSSQSDDDSEMTRRRTVRINRDRERTRKSARGVERSRGGQSIRSSKEQSTAMGQLQPSARREPYARSASSVSSEVIDSLVEELNPIKEHQSAHLPTAASVIQANRLRSYRLSTDEPSYHDSSELPEVRRTEQGASRCTSSIFAGANKGLRESLITLGPFLRSTSTSSTRSQFRQVSASPSNTVASSALAPSTIQSIDDIIRRHAPAAADAEAAAKAKAKKEIASAAPTMKENPKHSAKSVTDYHRPLSPSNDKAVASPLDSSPIPGADGPNPRTITTSTPAKGSSRNTWQPNRVPAGAMFQPEDGTSVASYRAAESTSTVSGDDFSQGIQMNQALLDQLEHGSTSPSTHSTQSSARRISLMTPSSAARVTTPTRGAVLAKRKSLPANPSAVSSTPMQESDAQAHARYLCSPHLNRIITLPRTFPERPLRISFAEVGTPTGHPVVIFLGLGCVRYLIALFDDIARAFNLRLICIDRWGFGKTDNVSQGSRGVVEWAKIVEQVLDLLGIRTFQILAHSAGAPYALACALRLETRVRGMIYLLAPWVGADVDGGYKWLKWVPNGLIKSATAAEWRLQSYLLGKPPPLPDQPITHEAMLPNDIPFVSHNSPPRQPRSPAHSSSKPAKGLFRRASRIFASRSMDPLHDTATTGARPPRRALTLHSELIDYHPYTNESDPLDIVRLESERSLSSSESMPILRTSSPDVAAGLDLDWDLIEAFDLLPLRLGSDLSDEGQAFPANRPLPVRHTSAPPTIDDRPRAPSGAEFTLALMQASHAECEPGTTADLLSIILKRNSGLTSPQGSHSPSHLENSAAAAMSWGFSYTDISQPVRIWYGSQDDKISEKSMRWMERCMNDVDLKIVNGEGHGLMTSAAVMWEVFESLAKTARNL